MKATTQKKSKSSSAAAKALEMDDSVTVVTGYGNYNRLEYIRNWKKIKHKQHILESDKLRKYVDDLVTKYPEKYLEILKFDLSTNINFNRIVSEMDFFNVDEDASDEESSDELMETIRTKSQVGTESEEETFEP